MAYTLQDVQEWAMQSELVARNYTERPGRDWLRVADFAFAHLIPDLPWAYAGDLAYTKTWSLVANVNTYSFTGTDSFRGVIDSLLVFWNSDLTDCREATRMAGRLQDVLIAGDSLVGTDADDPCYLISGLDVSIYPAPTNSEGQLWAQIVKRPTAFAAMADSIQISDEAAMALAYQMGGLVVADPNAMQALFGLAKQELIRLRRDSRGQGIVMERR